MGRLDKIYGTRATYIHLKRFSEDVIESYSRRFRTGIMRAYRGKGILLGISDDVDKAEIVRDYIHTVDSNIELFLKDKTRKMVINIEQAKEMFPFFCELIDADVDMGKALSHFDKRYNESKRSKRNNTGKE